jgi:hypothetical protein
MENNASPLLKIETSFLPGIYGEAREGVCGEAGGEISYSESS